jgi:hypothetical protein
MNKSQIKEIAKRLFVAGKNNLADYLFEEYFEEIYKEEKNGSNRTTRKANKR